MDDLTALRVLLIEDDAASAELTAELLREALHEPHVVTARSLRSGLAALAADNVDLVLVDLGLPDAEGLDAVISVRDASDPGVAVVVLTGLDAEEMAEQALRHGAQDYLSKNDLEPRAVRRSARYAVLRARADSALRGALHWAQSVLNSVESPMCALDSTGAIVAVNRVWDQTCLANDGELEQCGLGVNYLEVCHRAARTGDASAAAVEHGLRRVLTGADHRFQAEYPCHSPDAQRWFSLRAVPTAGQHGAVLTHVDITSLRQAEHKLSHQATHDPLTGLGNRRLLLSELEHRLSTGDPDLTVAVLFADLDHFKQINDRYGHAAGDRVLVTVADRVRQAIRADDVLVRLGGDEFVVVASIADEAEALTLADRVQQAMCRPVRTDGEMTTITVSQGLVLVDVDSPTGTDELLRAADAAMYEAKAQGRARVCLYSDDLRQRTKEQVQLTEDLERTITEQDGLELHFQPIVMPDFGGVHAVEALLRWRHPERGLLSPSSFLPLADASGLIVPIGAWVVEAACRQGRELHDSGLHVAMSVNLSAMNLTDGEIVRDVTRALDESGFPATSLIIEVTETTMLEDHPGSVETLNRLRSLGAQVAVDDFGTGYSSLAYLRRFPVDGLKIDRSFVAELPDNADDLAIVGSVISLARALDLWVVAEGVENERQLAALLELGCELAQGHFYARATAPVGLEAVIRQLSARSAVRQPSPSVRRRQAAGPPAEVVAPAVLQRMRSMNAAGASLNTIAAALNSRGEKTAGGLRWHPRSVARALADAETARPQRAGSG